MDKFLCFEGSAHEAEAVYWADLRAGMSAGCFDLLGVLRDYFRRYGELVFPSIETLGDRARCSPRSVDNHLVRLVSLGLLAVGKANRLEGRWQHNVYEPCGDFAVWLEQNGRRVRDKARERSEAARRFAWKLARKLADNRIAEAVKQQIAAYKAAIVRKKTTGCAQGVAFVPHASFAHNVVSSIKVLKEPVVAKRSTRFLEDFEAGRIKVEPYVAPASGRFAVVKRAE